MVSDAGFAPNSPVIVQTLLHVSQIAASRDIYRNTWAASLAGELLADLVPMEKHAGTVIQGDQDALNFGDSVDVLRSVMSAIRRRSLSQRASHHPTLTLRRFRRKISKTYAIIQRADTRASFRVTCADVDAAGV